MAHNVNSSSEPQVKDPIEEAAPAPKDAKKKRLWLGFSAEHLRSNLNLESRRERKNASKNTLSIGQPEDNQALEDLDEVAAPAPVGWDGDNTTGYLEDRDVEAPQSANRSNRFSGLATDLYTVSYLILFSIFGTLARIGLQALTFYPGAPVQTGVLWANVGGSLVLGFLSEDRKLFQEEWGTQVTQPQVNGEVGRKAEKDQSRSSSETRRHGNVKKTLPLYIGLATGFCGCFTSFSSFMRDTFYALANALPVPINHPSTAPISQTMNVPRNPGYSFLAILAVLITTVGLSLGALQVGGHLALALDRRTPSVPHTFNRKVIDPLSVFLAWGCWLGAIFMAIFPPDRPGGPVGRSSWRQETWRSQALFAIVFAPPGCLLRYYVSQRLNSRVKSFPLGTFAVNIFGTAVEAMFIDLQRTPIGGMVGCQVLQGMSDGFCGCLTTVSTWVLELKGLRTRHAYFYGGMSIAVGLSLFVVITGSLLWTRGFASLMCVT